MGMETLLEPSDPPKKSDFGYQVSSGYVGRVDLRFFGFGRVFLTAKHEAIIMKENSNLYLERYNDTSDLVLLSSRG